MKNHVSVSLDNFMWPQDSYLSAKAEDPAIENMIYRCFHGDGKSLFINQSCVNGLPKLIYNRIHHGEITCHFYCFALTVVHSHHRGTIFFQIKTVRFGDDGLIQYLRNMCNPIYAEVGHNAVLLIIAHDIIEVVIPYERIRAQYIRDTVVTQFSPLIDVIFKIPKGNLIFLKNRSVNSIYDVVNLFITLFQAGIIARLTQEIIPNVLWCKPGNLLRQFPTFAFCDEKR